MNRKTISQIRGSWLPKAWREENERNKKNVNCVCTILLVLYIHCWKLKKKTTKSWFTGIHYIMIAFLSVYILEEIRMKIRPWFARTKSPWECGPRSCAGLWCPGYWDKRKELGEQLQVLGYNQALGPPRCSLLASHHFCWGIGTAENPQTWSKRERVVLTWYPSHSGFQEACPNLS